MASWITIAMILTPFSVLYIRAFYFMLDESKTEDASGPRWKVTKEQARAAGIKSIANMDK